MNEVTILRNYVIATVSLAAVAAVAAIGLCIMTFIGVQRRADPARFAAPWLKAASVFLLLVVLLALARYSIYLWQLDNYMTRSRQTLSDLNNAGFHIVALFTLFDSFAQFCIVVMLASVAAGAHSISRNGVAAWVKFLRWGVVAFGAIALALGIATYGVRVAGFDNNYGFYSYDLYEAGNKLSTASAIIMWLASLGTAGMSFLAMGSRTRTVGILLILANFLNVLGNTWFMAYCIRWALSSHFTPNYVLILEVVLGKWTSLGVLILCYFIMAKRAGGIWTVGAYGSDESRNKDPRVSAGHSSIERPNY